MKILKESNDVIKLRANKQLRGKLGRLALLIIVLALIGLFHYWPVNNPLIKADIVLYTGLCTGLLIARLTDTFNFLFSVAAVDLTEDTIQFKLYGRRKFLPILKANQIINVTYFMDTQIPSTLFKSSIKQVNPKKPLLKTIIDTLKRSKTQATYSAPTKSTSLDNTNLNDTNLNDASSDVTSLDTNRVFTLIFECHPKTAQEINLTGVVVKSQYFDDLSPLLAWIERHHIPMTAFCA